MQRNKGREKKEEKKKWGKKCFCTSSSWGRCRKSNAVPFSLLFFPRLVLLIRKICDCCLQLPPRNPTFPKSTNHVSRSPSISILAASINRTSAQNFLTLHPNLSPSCLNSSFILTLFSFLLSNLFFSFLLRFQPAWKP